MTYSGYVGTAQRGSYSVAHVLFFPHVDSEHMAEYHRAHGPRDIGTVVRAAIEHCLESYSDAEYINVWAETDIINQIPRDDISEKFRFMTPEPGDQPRLGNLRVQNSMAQNMLDTCAE